MRGLVCLHFRGVGNVADKRSEGRYVAVQAPLQVYARMLAQKAQQQRALQRADAVQADREDDDASSDDEELQAGSAGSAQASADAGEALAASALPLAQKKAAKAVPARQQNPKVHLSDPWIACCCQCIWDVKTCVLPSMNFRV